MQIKKCDAIFIFISSNFNNYILKLKIKKKEERNSKKPLVDLYISIA